MQEALLYAVAEAIPSTGRLVLVIESAGLVDIDPSLAAAIVQVRGTVSHTSATICHATATARTPSQPEI
jgi:hypothetical protein